MNNREKIIVRTSVYGILVNLLLVGFKATVGIIAGSIAIVLDALNNLTDMLSSVVTIVGAKLAGRSPDKEHPYGHGRIEYVSTLIVGLIVLTAGVTAIVEAVPKIFHPELPDYSWITILVVGVAVLVKFFFGRFVKKTGEQIKSGSLVASGTDAIMDSVLSFGTLVGIAVSMIWGVSIDGWIGTLIAIFIIKASIEMLGEGWLDVVGRRVDSDLAKKIKADICRFEGVNGAYDLSLHNYGPSEVIGSIHVQVPDKMTAREIHKLTRDITTKVFLKYGIILTIGIYAENIESKENKEIYAKIKEIEEEYAEILQVHGFYVDEDDGVVAFDLVMDYQCKDRNAIRSQVVRKMKASFPRYKFMVTLDADVSD